MEKTNTGKTKKKAANILVMAGITVIFIAYMFPFVMVVINSLKQKRDIIKSPFSWLFTIKGLSFDNFAKAFTQMDFLNAFKNSLIVTVSATVLVTLFAAMLAYYIVRNNNMISFKSQADFNLFAYWIFDGYVCIYVSRIYQRKYSDCIRGSCLHRRLDTCADIFYDCTAIVKTNYIDDGYFKFHGILE